MAGDFSIDSIILIIEISTIKEIKSANGKLWPAFPFDDRTAASGKCNHTALNYAKWPLCCSTDCPSLFLLLLLLLLQHHRYCSVSSIVLQGGDAKRRGRICSRVFCTYLNDSIKCPVMSSALLCFAWPLLLSIANI